MKYIHLKELLSERGAKAALSRATNISTGNISDWFSTGSRESKPSLETLCKLADYFNCSVDYLLDRTENRYNHSVICKFPIYNDQQAAAGAGIYGRDGDFSMENLLIDDIPSRAVFGLRIQGHSMEPYIQNNSIVLLDSKVTIENVVDKNIVASIDGEVICKHFSIKNNIFCFESLNDAYQNENRIISTYNFNIIGEVVKTIPPNR